jgi:hypothetical protein
MPNFAEAFAFCEENYVSMEAEPDGMWHLSVYSDIDGEYREGFGEGFLGAYRALLEKLGD